MLRYQRTGSSSFPNGFLTMRTDDEAPSERGFPGQDAPLGVPRIWPLHRARPLACPFHVRSRNGGLGAKCACGLYFFFLSHASDWRPGPPPAKESGLSTAHPLASPLTLQPALRQHAALPTRKPFKTSPGENTAGENNQEKKSPEGTV